ncbi:hypothetical protein [Streptomyces sp. NPDC057694]|uniref:hypothetical protein n=1 Tax=Streptomyces sp. NPDC057694 TaxID=3346216 RepID=UPI0036B02050
MSSRTSSRRRTAKVPASATVINMPRQRRSGRSGQPFIVVVPTHGHSWKQRLAAATGRAVWRHRHALIPSFAALAALPATALLHALAWWSGLVLAPLAAGPLVWLLLTQRRRPTSERTVLVWRIGLSLLATAAIAWAALAAAFNPLAGPLGLLWVLLWAIAQSGWLVVRHTR